MLAAARAAGLHVHLWINVNLVADATRLPDARTRGVHRHPEWLMVPRALAFFPDVSVEEGIRIFLTGGMALPDRMQPLTRTGEHADET